MARFTFTSRDSDKLSQIDRLWDRMRISCSSRSAPEGWHHEKLLAPLQHPSHHQQEIRSDSGARTWRFLLVPQSSWESPYPLWPHGVKTRMSGLQSLDILFHLLAKRNACRAESAPIRIGAGEMYRTSNRRRHKDSTNSTFRTQRSEHLEFPLSLRQTYRNVTSFRSLYSSVFRFDIRVVRNPIFSSGLFSRGVHRGRRPLRVGTSDEHIVQNLPQDLSQRAERASSEVKSKQNALPTEEDSANMEKNWDTGLLLGREDNVDSVGAIPGMGLSRLAKKIRYILGGGGRSWEALAGLRLYLSPSLVTKVLKVVEDFRLAYGFFKWAGEQQGYVNTADVYNIMVGKLAANRHVDGAVQLLEEMTAKGLKANIVTYTTVIHALCKVGDINTALKLFTEMGASGCPPNVYTYNALVNGLGKVGRVSEALDLFEDMKLKDCPPDVVTFNTLIDALGRSGKMEVAGQIFKEMEATGCTPDVVTYNSLIHGFGKVGRSSAACSVFQGMRRNGCAPDTVTYNSLMDALAKAKMWDQAFEILEEFQQSQSKPEAALYTCLIDALCKAKLGSQAFQVFQDMQRHGCTPDGFTYTTLVVGLGKSGEWDKVWSLVADMKGAGFTPNVVTYNSLIDSLGKSGQDEAAWRLFLEMEQNGVPPDVVTYNSLIAGLGKVGRLDQALHLLETMKSHGLTPTVVTFTSLINLHIKAGNIKLVWKLLEQMNLRGLKPNGVTYRALIGGFCRAGELEVAWDFLLCMLEMGHTPHVLTYKSLIDACYKAGKVDKMQELFAIIRQGSSGRKSGQLQMLEDYLEDLKLGSESRQGTNPWGTARIHAS